VTAIHGKLRYAVLIIPVLLLIAPLTLAIVPHAASAGASNPNNTSTPVTKDLSATAPTSVKLLKNTTYVVKNDMAVLINGTVDMTVKYGSAILTVKGTSNITLTAGDVINVSKDVLATLLPIESQPTPMGAPIASFTLQAGQQVHSVELAGGSYYVVGRPQGDSYARYLIITEDKAPPNKWWKTTVSNTLLNTIVYGSFKKYFTVHSGKHTVYVGISTFVGKWVVSIIDTGEPHPTDTNTGTDTLTPNTNTNGNGGTTSHEPLSAKITHNRWLVAAIAGGVVVIIIVGVLFAAAAHPHHRK